MIYLMVCFSLKTYVMARAFHSDMSVPVPDWNCDLTTAGLFRDAMF